MRPQMNYLRLSRVSAQPLIRYCSQNAMLSQVCTDTQGLTGIWGHRRVQLCTPPTPETFKRSLTVSLNGLFAAVDVASIFKIWHFTLS